MFSKITVLISCLTFCFGFSQKDCIYFKNSQDNSELLDISILVYKNNRTKILSDEGNGKICNQTELISKADSLVAIVNTQRLILNKSIIKTGAVISLTLDNELSAVYLESSRKSFIYGPVKGSTRWKFFMSEGHMSGLRLPIDSTIVNKLIIGININIHGQEYFRTSRKNKSEFTLGIYHTESEELKELTTIYEDDSELFFVEDKRMHWLHIDFQEKSIYIPESGFLVVMIYVKKGGFVLRRFDKPKYPNYKTVGTKHLDRRKLEILEWDFISAINLTLQ